MEGEPYDPVKVSTLTHTIIQTIALYGHRLKSIPNSERVLVVIEARAMHGPDKLVEVSTVLERTGNRSTQAPQTTEPKVEPKVAALLEKRRQLDETVWAQIVAGRKANSNTAILKLWDRRLRPRIDDHRVLAFKKSDLQQERSYDSIKDKVETTDY